MRASKNNIFIVNRNPQKLEELSDLISNRFGSIFNLKKFNNNNSAIYSISKTTKIIVFDNSLESYQTDDTLYTMKKSHPGIKSIMCSTHEEIEMAIDYYCQKKPYRLFRKGKTWEKIKPSFYQLNKPIKYYIQEFLIKKYMLIYFLTFLIIGICVYYSIFYYN